MDSGKAAGEFRNLRAAVTTLAICWPAPTSPLRSPNSPAGLELLTAECSRMTEYKGYRIEPFEPEPGRWCARISRLDGKKLKTAVPPTEQPFLDTQSAVSYGHAVEFAKQAIDGGGLD